MIATNKELLYPIAAAALALMAAALDIRSRRIPNWLTGPACAAGLVLHFGLDGWHGLLSSFGASLIAGSIFLLFFLADGMGGGDVKLITAVASMAGMTDLAGLLIFTSLAGGVMGIVLALRHGQLRSTLQQTKALASHHRHNGLTPHPQLNVKNAATLRLPYAAAIAAGSLAVVCIIGAQR